MRRLKRWIGMLAAATTLASPAVAGRSADYHALALMKGGYSEKRLATDRWRFFGRSQQRPFRRPDNVALPLAMYRGALVLKRQGYPYMQVVKGRLDETYSIYVVNQEAKIEVVGVRSADAPLTCENTKRLVELCRTWAVDEAIAAGGSALGHSSAEIAEDYAAVPAS